jgi:hypothetical protein
VNLGQSGDKRNIHRDTGCAVCDKGAVVTDEDLDPSGLANKRQDQSPNIDEKPSHIAVHKVIRPYGREKKRRGWVVHLTSLKVA